MLDSDILLLELKQLKLNSTLDTIQHVFESESLDGVTENVRGEFIE